MTHNINVFQNNAISQNYKAAPQPIIEAIHSASKKSGVNFSYLVDQAKVESSFNPDAKAKTSSATGLYQFIDSTWMDMINKYGDDYGLHTNGKSKSEILAMRKDPEAASFMAAAFASENEASLNRNWGGEVGSTELYLAHFMGAGGASAFLNARDENPMTPAADLFPRAARANRNVFYDPQSGQARSLDEVYRFFDKKFHPQTDHIQHTDIASAPIPPDIPNRKIAQFEPSVFNRTAINKNNLIMQRAQAMRDAQSAGAHHGQIDYSNHIAGSMAARSPLKSQFSVIDGGTKASPFLSLIAQPLDVLLLTQSVPSKVIRDNV